MLLLQRVISCTLFMQGKAHERVFLSTSNSGVAMHVYTLFEQEPNKEKGLLASHCQVH